MKHWCLIILTLISVSGFAQQSTEVKAMSYNIRLDHSGDNEDNWHHRKADMTIYLQSKSPDFIGMQEVQHHQLRYLDSSLQEYTYLGVGRDDGLTGGEYSPIFYNKKKWSPIESNTFWLSSTPSRVSRGWDAACHRVCTYGLFEDNSGKKILILNTHFDHVGNESRINSLRLIKDFVANFKDVSAVLMGDFNFDPSSELYGSLPNEFSDTFLMANNSATAPTYNGFKKDKIAKRRIDYLLLNEPSRFINYSVDHPKTKLNRQLSDHYPIQLTLSL